ncbi:MAG: hypothetical protein ACYTXC_20420 [Nostoc sp.]
MSNLSYYLLSFLLQRSYALASFSIKVEGCKANEKLVQDKAIASIESLYNQT